MRPEERRSKSPQERIMRGEVTKPVSIVEEVSKEPQYIVDREKVRNTLNRAHQIPCISWTSRCQW